ncbi:MAG TPA: nuclear transport factor 2 family protein [Candidatus Binatia bacterium]|jgi:hypothetical protein
MPQPDLRRLADRLEIEDLLVRYSTALDTKNYDLLDDVFTPDGIGDYTAGGGFKGTVPELKQWLTVALGIFTVVQHLVTNVAVEISGDEATSTCYLFNPLGYPAGEGLETMRAGGIYRDRLVRTAAGWRIRERVLTMLYLEGKMPGA